MTIPAEARTATLLLVDDEVGNRRAVARLLQDQFLSILEAGDGSEALQLLAGGANPDVILLDLMMPGMDGITFLQEMAAHKQAPVPVLVLSANTNISRAVEAMKLGAIDYVEKPVEPEILRRRIASILETRELKLRNQQLLERVASSRRRLLGNASAMQRVHSAVERLARNSSTVLVTGESGTGKELVARSLHEFSERAGSPFVVVDCAALNPSTMVADLFGHERGAYTGADHRRDGLLAAAGKGTIFFDEVGELPLELQSRLLRVLQERQIRSLGSVTYRNLEARIVAATNRDLEAEVKAGRFREDLFWRLGIVSIRIPPLRERREDIPLLVDHFLNKYASDYGQMSFTSVALDALVAFDWPGNVRQLENTIHSCMAMAQSGQEILDLETLPIHMKSNPQEAEMAEGNTKKLPPVSMQEAERIAIQRALEFTGSNRRQAAEILGIGEATLYRKLKDYRLSGDAL